MHKRSYLNVFIRTFLYGFIAFSIVFGLIVFVYEGLLKYDMGMNLIVLVAVSGLIFGVLWGAAMSFSYRGILREIEIKSKDRFTRSIDKILNSMRYIKSSEDGNLLVYSSNRRIDYFVGKIFVEIDNEKAVIVGSKIYIEKIVKLYS